MISVPDGRSANFFSFRICDLRPLQQNETRHWPQNFIVSPISVGKQVKFLLVRHNVVRKFKTVVKLLDSIKCEATTSFESFYVNRIILQVSRFDKWVISNKITKSAFVHILLPTISFLQLVEHSFFFFPCMQLTAHALKRQKHNFLEWNSFSMFKAVSDVKQKKKFPILLLHVLNLFWYVWLLARLDRNKLP